jgi:hypothetical protein
MLKYDTEIIIPPKTIITFFWSRLMSNYATMRGRFPNLPETNAESPHVPFVYACVIQARSHASVMCSAPGLKAEFLSVGRCTCSRLKICSRGEGSERSAAKSSFRTSSIVVRKFVNHLQCICSRSRDVVFQMLPTKKLSPRPSGCDFGV